MLLLFDFAAEFLELLELGLSDLRILHELGASLEDYFFGGWDFSDQVLEESYIKFAISFHENYLQHLLYYFLSVFIH